MRAAARLLMIESKALRPVLEAAPEEAFGRPTVCPAWSVRDVLAHCAAALSMCADGRFHAFTPEDNQADVDARAGWSVDALLDELFTGYETAATAVDAAAGGLDGIGLGEWIHGGDVREPLGAGDAYRSPGVELAVGLLVERSGLQRRPPLSVIVDGERYPFGGGGEASARLVTDNETFVRLCGGRLPDPARLQLSGAYDLDDLVLFG